MIAETLIALALLIAVVHIYWALGGSGKSNFIPQDEEGTPLFKASATACIFVAFCFLLVAAYAYFKMIGLALPSLINNSVKYIVAIIFLLRAIGDFKYIGLFKKVKSTEFSRYDTYYLSPLCLLMAGLSLWL